MYWYLPFAWTLSFWEGLSHPAPYVAAELQERDVDMAAQLHADAFSHPWSGDELASLLSQPGTFGFAVRRSASPLAPLAGFVLARLTLDEGEILTIAVDPAFRGKGVGRLLMDQVLQRLHAERAASLFLEVEEANAPARALYRRLRFVEVGRRPAYYVGPDGERLNALILKRTLRS